MNLSRQKLGILLLLILGVNYFAPKFSTSIEKKYTFSTRFTDAHGELLRLSLSQDDKYRLWTDISEIPITLRNHLLEKEDQYFYYHFGVNPFSLLKAVFKTYVLRERKYGASTLSMQLARLHYKINSRSVLGKLNQIVHALVLEVLYTKDQILEAYFNLAPYGKNIEGIKAGSLIYFKKNIAKLNLKEFLFLATLPQNPALLNHHDKFQAIPNKIDKKIIQLAKVLKLKDSFLNKELWIHSINELPFRAKHLVMKYEQTSSKQEIQLTLKSQIQELAQELVSSYIYRRADHGLKNASVMILDYRNMNVLASVGSADFNNHEILGQNDGTRALRSPGSTLKPFIYGLAFEQGHIHTQSVLYDAPLTFRTPENFDNKFLGPISAEDALIRSRNVPAVYLNSLIKSPDLFSYLKESSIIGKRRKNHYGSSIALGGLEVTMEDLVKLYATLGNEGISKDIQYTFSADEQKQKRVMSKEAAIMTLDVLSKNDRPDELNEYNFYKDQRKVSWKTGTSIGFRDAWSVGLFGPYVVAVWVGNFNGKAHPGLIGSLAAGPLFFEIIDALKPFTPEEDELRYSEKLVEIKVCTLSGKIPSKDCPHKKKALFWTGVSPIDQCNVHRKFTLSQETGLRTCLSSKGRTYDKIYEVWPMPIHNIYRKLKFAQKLPPSFDPLCKLEEKIAFKSRDIKIISPQNGVEYQYREGDKKHDLYFDAWADSDTKSLFWYLDNKFIGKSKNSESFVWNSKPGTYLLQVQDDRGNVALRTLKVNLIE